MSNVRKPFSSLPFVYPDNGKLTPVAVSILNELITALNSLNGGAIYAPHDAKYIIQSVNGGLPNAQALSSLTPGFLKTTTSNGVITSTGSQYIKSSDLENSGADAGTYGENGYKVAFTINSKGIITNLYEDKIKDLPYLYKIGSKITSELGNVPAIRIQNSGIAISASLNMQASSFYWTVCDNTGANYGNAFHGMSGGLIYSIADQNEFYVSISEISFSMQDETTPVRIEQRGGDELGRLYFYNGTYNTGFKAGAGATSDQILELPDTFPAGNNYAMVSSISGKLSFLQVPTGSGTSSGTNTGDQNLFSTIAVSGQSNVIADTTSDTVTFVAGTGMTITTDPLTDTVTFESSGGSYTDEQAQDAVGTILTDSSSIDFTYTDGTPEITAVVKPGGVTNTMLAGSIDLSTKMTGILPIANVETGPSFRAYAGSTTSITQGTVAKVALNTEDWDDGGLFDSSTNYRFTPNVAGVYTFSFGVYISDAQANVAYGPRLYKNGSLVSYGWYGTTGSANDFVMTSSAQVRLNGTTDYIELYFYNNSGSAACTTVASSSGTFLSGAWLRS